MEGTFVVWMAGVVVLVAAQMVEYVLESNQTPTERLRFPVVAQDLPPGDATGATERPFEYDHAA